MQAAMAAGIGENLGKWGGLAHPMRKYISYNKLNGFAAKTAGPSGLEYKANVSGLGFPATAYFFAGREAGTVH